MVLRGDAVIPHDVVDFLVKGCLVPGLILFIVAYLGIGIVSFAFLGIGKG